jgi:hypothetical protein
MLFISLFPLFPEFLCAATAERDAGVSFCGYFLNGSCCPGFPAIAAVKDNRKNSSGGSLAKRDGNAMGEIEHRPGSTVVILVMTYAIQLRGIIL